MTPDPQTTAITVAGAVTGFGAALGPTAKLILEKMLGPVADVFGEHFRDRARNYLAQNAEAALSDAAQKVQASGREPRTIPLRTAIPLIDGASKEDDHSLRDMWSSLLANASIGADPETVPPSFAHIMGQLSPFDARLAQAIAAGPEVERADEDLYDLFGDEAFGSRIQSSVDLLSSLGLVARRRIQQTPLRPGIKDSGAPVLEIPMTAMTALGERFMRACTAPTAGPH